MKSKAKKSAEAKLYKIEKGMRVPEVTQATASVTVGAVAATMAKLEKGESFLIKHELAAMKGAVMFRGFRQRESERKGTRIFISRKVGKGLRIWRTQ